LQYLYEIKDFLGKKVSLLEKVSGMCLRKYFSLTII